MKFTIKKGNIPYTGVLRNYFPTGEISLINNFKDGKQHGSFKSFHRNGNLAMEGQFLDGKQHDFGVNIMTMVNFTGN